MKILIIELCNFLDYPTGGQLAFVRNMMSSFTEELMLVGCGTDRNAKTGKWESKDINGKSYLFFSVRNYNPQIEKTIIPKRLSGYLALRFNMRKILSEDFDLIFTQSPEILLALPHKVLNRVAIDLPGLNNPLEYSRYAFARLFSNLFARKIYKRLSHVRKIWATACSEDIKNFKNKSPYPLDDVLQLPTGYDSSTFMVMDRIMCRKDLGLNEKAIISVTVGRHAKGKGWKLMIDAFKECRFDDESLFYIIGNGEDKDRIEAYIHESGLDGRVILTGKQSPSTIARFLNAADIFVMGSEREGWSTTLVEACACGVPCVVTDFSSASDMITNGRNGYVIQSFESAPFAKGMKDALNLDRNEVSAFNRRYEQLAICHLQETMLSSL